MPTSVAEDAQLARLNELHESYFHLVAKIRFIVYDRASNEDKIDRIKEAVQKFDYIMSDM